MHFLPIVDRELRRAMRRKSTVRWRLISVTLVSAIAGLFMGAREFVISPSIGRTLFILLAGYTGIICLLAGPMFTADSISEERRDGTLELLFLSNLNGYDVVLGKFVSLALNVAYGILAVQPIMAIPILIGGVSGAEFWRLSLAMLNLLFFSLTLGILVSVASLNTDKPGLRTTWLLILFCGAFPLLARGANAIGFTQAGAALDLVNPATPLWIGYGAGTVFSSSRYWNSLLFAHVLGWLFLVLASLWLPLNWRQKPFRQQRDSSNNIGAIFHRPDPATRAMDRARLLSVNPIDWLAGDVPGMVWAVWILTAIAILIPVGAAMVEFQYLPEAIVSVLLPVQFLLTVLVAIQSSRFFVDARRSNTLELLLCTPLRNQDLIKGQWLALNRIFFSPVLVVSLLQFAGIPLALFMGTRASVQPFPVAGILPLVGFILVPGFFILHLVAIGWAGMCLGVTLEKPQHATRLTVLLILVMLPLRYACCIPTFPVDILIIAVARTRVYRSLRPQVRRAELSTPFFLPPLIGPPRLPPPLPR